MKYEIEITCPEGYEPTGEYRRPKFGETYQDQGANTIALTVGNGYAPSGDRLILRRKWTPAPWMPRGCELVRDFTGEWYFNRGPGKNFYATEVAGAFGETFDPPPTSPYQL